jgi:hypothetical protein
MIDVKSVSAKELVILSCKFADSAYNRHLGPSRGRWNVDLWPPIRFAADSELLRLDSHQSQSL